MDIIPARIRSLAPMRMPQVVAGMRVEPVSRADRLVSWMERDEPRSSRALSDLLANPLSWGSCRAWRIEHPDGTPAAAIVAVRTCFDMWHAVSYLPDPSGAPAVAHVIDHSPVRQVIGTFADVQPLLAHLSRFRRAHTAPRIVVPPPVSVTGEVDERTRLATAADLPRLVELYRGYENASEATTWQAAQSIRHIVHRHLVLVTEEGGALIAAMVVSVLTRQYLGVDMLTVAPEHRGRRLSWGLIGRAQALANALGLGGLATIAPTNPMTAPAEHVDPEQTWMAAMLRPPERLPGEAAGRRAYEKVMRRQARAFEPVREFTTISRRDLRSDAQEGPKA